MKYLLSTVLQYGMLRHQTLHQLTSLQEQKMFKIFYAYVNSSLIVFGLANYFKIRFKL